MTGDGKMYGFVPGQKVWVRSAERTSGEYFEAVIAPLARQVAYQAKANWRQRTVVIMRKATGVIGKPMDIDRLLPDTAGGRAFVSAARAEKAAEVALRGLCAKEGLVWGGKLCQARLEWQTYSAARKLRAQSEDALRDQIVSAKPWH
jgi:hypothetical protein